MQSTAPILCGLRVGSDARLVRSAAGFARARRQPLHVLHAVPTHQPFSWNAAERAAALEAARQEATAAGIDAHTIVQHGDPAAVIVLHAQAGRADLIVLGRPSHARGRSLAERVAVGAGVPVVIVPPTPPLRSQARVLFAPEVSPPATTALGSLVPSFVADASDQVWHFLLRDDDRCWHDTRRRLEVLLSERHERAIRVRLHAARRAASVLRYAERLDVDLIVTAASSGWRSWLGTPLRTLLRFAPCPVLVLPRADGGRAPALTGTVRRPSAAFVPSPARSARPSRAPSASSTG